MTHAIQRPAPTTVRYHAGADLGAPDRFLRIHQVSDMSGLARATIYQRMKLGQFPAQVRIGPKSVAWLASDIQAWMQSRITAPQN
ncbi:MAG: AlpA family transcriptional regulator [Achromobacter sp.]|nr:AlpA family transcriptional regulator [Achromobacter sp.]